MSQKMGHWAVVGARSGPWTINELRDAFAALKDQGVVRERFYFHVDGLDEYAGDHYEIIAIIQNLAKSPAIKLCVSSHPWNCFLDTLGAMNKGTLQLHTLTKEDIELFALDSIRSYCGFRSQNAKRGYKDLSQEIGYRSQGVFLWVRMVVHSLREGFQNDEQMSLLRKRLEERPTDLEESFEHILQ